METFYIIIDERPVKVAFLTDYVKEKGYSRFLYEKAVALGEEKSLKIADRYKNAYFAVVDKKDMRFLKDKHVIGDKNGAIEIIHPETNKRCRVMFMSDYAAAFGYANKQTAEHQENRGYLKSIRINACNTQIKFIIL